MKASGERANEGNNERNNAALWKKLWSPAFAGDPVTTDIARVFPRLLGHPFARMSALNVHAGFRDTAANR